LRDIGGFLRRCCYALDLVLDFFDFLLQELKSAGSFVEIDFVLLRIHKSDGGNGLDLSALKNEVSDFRVIDFKNLGVQVRSDEFDSLEDFGATRTVFADDDNKDFLKRGWRTEGHRRRDRKRSVGLELRRMDHDRRWIHTLRYAKKI
jgi:hypothetical protein